MDDKEHKWSYCYHCETKMVICGKCGNNCCNGEYGEMFGPEPGVMLQCDACPSAYELQENGYKTAAAEIGRGM